jgi:hypothetical protein
MAWDDAYLDLDNFKARVNVTDDRADVVLTQIITAASRAVEQWTGRVFNQSPAGTIRYFDAVNSRAVMSGDLVSVAELASDGGARTYDTVWPIADYELWPYDAAETGRPYQQIRGVNAVFPRWRRGVRVTGVFGWPTVPALIVEAVAIQANRYWKRQTAPFGIAGAPGTELGQVMAISSLDPDVKQMISTYKRVVL